MNDVALADELRMAVVVADDAPADVRARGQVLAQKLGVDLLDDSQTQQQMIELQVHVTPRRLELHWHEQAGDERASQRPRKQQSQPVVIDWSTLRTASAAGMSLKQPVVRALGLKSLKMNPPVRVIDATAGWGEDAWVMASLGCEVTLIERQPIMAAMLEDALDSHRAASPNTVSRITLMKADAIAYLCEIKSDQADVIHLDPMFPATGKSAAQNRSMRLLKHLAGDDADADSLWQAAMATGVKRVVVKRPPHAPPLGKKPDAKIESKASRYDVYLNAHE